MNLCADFLARKKTTMISVPDFEKKQIAIIFFNEGEKLAFSNDNMIVKDADGKIKFQSTCYRIFMVCAVGNFSITTVLLQKAKKFGFFVALFTQSWRMYDVVGAVKDGNTLLKRKQYTNNSNDIAIRIVKNKIANQCLTLQQVRDKNELEKEAIAKLKEYYLEVDNCADVHPLMAYEGLASKVYFSNHFNNILWRGRQPRVKRDSCNCVLDIGYTLLFSFVDAILLSFGFDTYVGVLHKQFYMRKSLTCDIVEPFRFVVDKAVKKAYNLRQIQEEHFKVEKGIYKLKYENNKKYILFLMQAILDIKDDIFKYIQSYYRCVMKESPIEDYPMYIDGEIINGTYKL